MKKIFILLICILLLLLLFPSCKNNRKNNQGRSNAKEEHKEMNNSNELRENELFIINNENDAESIIKNEYLEETFMNKVPFHTEDLISVYPAECIREGKNNNYIIYKSDRQHFWFVMLSDKNDYIESMWYCGKHLTINDFIDLYQNKSSFDEVQEFDPYGDYSSSYMGNIDVGLVSYHHTIGGDLIELKYNDIGEVCSIAVKNSELYNNLLPIDKKMIDNHFTNN